MSKKGGGARAVTDFACQMASKKVDACIVGDSFHHEWKHKLQQKQVEMYSISETPLSGMKRWNLLSYYIRKTERLIPASSKLVIPCSFPATVAATKFKQKTGIPCVYYCFEPYRLFHEKEAMDSLNLPMKIFFKSMSRLYKATEVEAAKQCDLIIGDSQYTASNILKTYDVSPNKVKVVYLGADTNFFKPTIEPPPFIADFIKKGKKIIFVPTGKNLPRVLKALSIVQYRNFIAVLPSDYFEKNNVAALIKEYGLEQNVLILQKIPESSLPALYTFSDLVLYMPIGEPFGLVPVEAMACETPVVAPNIAGPSESVLSNVTGLTVDPFSPIEISENIDALLNDKDRSVEMGKAGRKRVLDLFEVGKITDDLLRIISQVH